MFFLLLFSACSLNTQVFKPVDLTNYKSGVLSITIDYWDLQDDLSRRIENLGIDVIDLSSTQEPDILVNVRYQPVCQRLPMLECKLTFFDIYFKDSKTGDVLISSRYKNMGDLRTTITDLNYVDDMLDSFFEDIKNKLQIQ